MKSGIRIVLLLAALGLVAAGRQPVFSETFDLELKHLTEDSKAKENFLYSRVSSQGLYLRKGHTDSRVQEFASQVKKEPKYKTSDPIQGVLKLGDDSYLVALDASDFPDSGYDRLYLDKNGNKDLTDDGMVEAAPQKNRYGGNYRNRQFADLKMSLRSGGKEIDYFLSGRVYSNADSDEKFSYAGASFRARTYRESLITLAGKEHRIAILDYNSNGRFDDKATVNEQINSGDGRLWPTSGDMLVVDPDFENKSIYPSRVTDRKEHQHIKFRAIQRMFAQIPGGNQNRKQTSEDESHVEECGKVIYHQHGVPPNSGKCAIALPPK